MNPLKTIVAAAGFSLLTTFSAQAFTISLLPVQTHQHSTQVTVTGCRAVDAAINGTPFFQMPTIAAEQGASGTAAVRIQLSSTGSLLSTSLIESTGNPNLDRAALQSARMTRYLPEISGCRAIGGFYRYQVTF